jgi:hypothetical protein
MTHLGDHNTVMVLLPVSVPAHARSTEVETHTGRHRGEHDIVEWMQHETDKRSLE